MGVVLVAVDHTEVVPPLCDIAGFQPGGQYGTARGALERAGLCQMAVQGGQFRVGGVGGVDVFDMTGEIIRPAVRHAADADNGVLRSGVRGVFRVDFLHGVVPPGVSAGVDGVFRGHTEMDRGRLNHGGGLDQLLLEGGARRPAPSGGRAAVCPGLGVKEILNTHGKRHPFFR